MKSERNFKNLRFDLHYYRFTVVYIVRLDNPGTILWGLHTVVEINK